MLAIQPSLETFTMQAQENRASSSWLQTAWKLSPLALSIIGSLITVASIPGTPGLVLASVIMLLGTAMTFKMFNLFQSNCFNGASNASNLVARFFMYGNGRGNNPPEDSHQTGLRHPVGGHGNVPPQQQFPPPQQLSQNPPPPHQTGLRHPVGGHGNVPPPQQFPPPQQPSQNPPPSHQRGPRHPVGGHGNVPPPQQFPPPQQSSQNPPPPHQTGLRHSVGGRSNTNT